MNGRSESPACVKLVRGFEQNRVFAHVHPYELYRNWLEVTWAFLEAVNNPQGFKECLDKHSSEEGAEFARLFGVYMDAVGETPFRDILGDLFMRLNLNAAKNGQVFTPWDVAEMMARMQFSREHFESIVREKGVVSVVDPAVGSGALLLAFAKVVHDELGRWGVNRLRLYGTDIDVRCVLMCRIQLRMNGLDSFGRMAGLLAASKGSPEAVVTAEEQKQPDISQAVILHGEEWQEEDNRVAKQPALL